MPSLSRGEPGKSMGYRTVTVPMDAGRLMDVRSGLFVDPESSKRKAPISTRYGADVYNRTAGSIASTPQNRQC